MIISAILPTLMAHMLCTVFPRSSRVQAEAVWDSLGVNFHSDGSSTVEKDVLFTTRLTHYLTECVVCSAICVRHNEDDSDT